MTRVLKNVIGRQKRRVRGRCDSKEWPKRANVAGFEDRRKGSTNHKPRNVGGLQKLARQGYGFSSRAFRGTQSSGHFEFSPASSMSDF